METIFNPEHNTRLSTSVSEDIKKAQEYVKSLRTPFKGSVHVDRSFLITDKDVPLDTKTLTQILELQTNHKSLMAYIEEHNRLLKEREMMKYYNNTTDNVETISLTGVVNCGPVIKGDDSVGALDDSVITVKPRAQVGEVPSAQFNLADHISPDTYQEACWDLAMPTARTISYMGFGLAGEVGEVLSLYAKAERDEHEVDNEELTKELGDCLWFIAGMCTLAGLSLDEVMRLNLKKLTSRKLRGTLKGSGDNR